ncbi:MAG: hypothetical protein U0556_03855 [Dehalococcoidia bacterium]
MARVPAILRPLGGPWASVPNRSDHAGRFVADPSTPLGVVVSRSLAGFALAIGAAALLALLLTAIPGAVAVDPMMVALATVNTLVLASGTVGTTLLLAALLALAAVAGPLEIRPAAVRSLELATALPPVVVALALVVVVGVPVEPGWAVLAIVGAQSLVFGPQVARRLARVALQTPVSVDEAAIDLGATGWKRFGAVVWPALGAAMPGIIGSVAALALADVVTPVLLGGPLLTLPGLIWTHALAGNPAIAALMAIALMAVGALTWPIGRGALASPLGPALKYQASRFDLPAGWSSLVLTLSVAVLFPLVMAPLVLVTAAGGDLASLASAWLAALGAALAGGSGAVLLSLGLRQLGVLGGLVGRLFEITPPAVLGLAVVVAFGGALATGVPGSFTLLAVVGLFVGLQAAHSAVPSPTSPASVAAAARDLGADPSSVTPPLGMRRLLTTSLFVAAETLRTGAFAFVVLAGIDHPTVASLSASRISDRPAASAAALSILAAVCLLRAAGGRLTRSHRMEGQS